jgi:hypothetical protein
MNIKAGQYITDGTAVFIVDDVRDGHRAGEYVFDNILRDGYIKANGATVTASEYPRLVQYAKNAEMIITEEDETQTHKFYYDEENDALRVPNLLNRFIEASDEVNLVSAGLPNISGDFSCMVDNYYGITATGATANWAYTTIGRYAMNDTSVTRHRNIIRYFRASTSNTIYGASATVQPPALKMIAQIKY